ncbi:hypothetical protein Hesp01_32190 [Herbidospora sp. NBRC 101105]|nr:hypothetical protein Hesp01_32190 [Herbidospora sp. NBRC 101105]
MIRLTQLLATVILAIGASTGVAHAMAHYLSGLDAVDEYEIRWTDSTKYNATMSFAHSTWNAQGCINIAQDNSSTVEDLEWIDYSSNDGINAYYDHDFPDADEIYLNTYYMDGFTATGLRNTMAHELGHALGLAHSYSGQLMYDYSSSITTPQSQDISDYDYLWC